MIAINSAKLAQIAKFAKGVAVLSAVVSVGDFILHIFSKRPSVIEIGKRLEDMKKILSDLTTEIDLLETILN